MSKTRASNYGRRKNNPFSTSTFKLEGLSQFDHSHTIAYDSDFGDLRPIQDMQEILGTRVRCNLAYVLNMDPLRKPLYSGINVTYDAVYVSDMLLGYDSNVYYNPASDDVERKKARYPYINASRLLSIYYLMGNYMNEDENRIFYEVARPVYNTLYDAFNYPFSSHAFDELGNVLLQVVGDAGSGLSYIPLSKLLGTMTIDQETGNALSYNGPWYSWDLVAKANLPDSYCDIPVGFSFVYPKSVHAPSNACVIASAVSVGATCSYTSSITSDNAVFYPFALGGVPPCASNHICLMSPLRYLLTHSSVFIPHGSQTEFVSWAADNSYVVWGDKSLLSSLNLDDIDWDALCRGVGYQSYQEYLDVYKSYLYSVVFAYIANYRVDLTPIIAYRRAYNDLYVNTNLWDCDAYSEQSIDQIFESSYLESLADPLPSVAGRVSVVWAPIGSASTGPDSWNNWLNLKFMKRWWPNDMFTSTVPADMSAAANAVEIPSSNVTLIDLRNLNIEQEVQERLNYAGQRTPDTTFAFFGFKSPELNYRYARHISRITDSPRIDNVLQNSETATTPLATPAGYGTGSKAARFFDFQMPWYGHILILSSVMTEPVYKDAVPRMILEKDYEDFLFPPYQEISDVSVSRVEVDAGADMSAANGVLGFQRSYYYYMRTNSKVNGTMRLAEKQEWMTSRDFRDDFRLNADFATPNASDRLNRIFANQSDGINHFNFFVGLDVQKILPLKRDIHYHL